MVMSPNEWKILEWDEKFQTFNKQTLLRILEMKFVKNDKDDVILTSGQVDTQNKQKSSMLRSGLSL